MENPLILLLFLAAALVRWLYQRAQDAKQEPTRPNEEDQQEQPISRQSETTTEEERIRRFLEALGQPTDAKPPPKVTPKRRVTPRQTVSAPTLPPLTTVPPPLVAPKVEAPIESLPPPLAVPLPPRIVPLAVAAKTISESPDFDAPGSSDWDPVPTDQRPSTDYRGFVLKLKSAHDLRTAIVLREVFGPPRSLQ